MIIPLEIVFHGTQPFAGVEARIREKAARLEAHHSHLASCRVVVDCPHHHHQQGNGWQVTVEMAVPPGHVLTASKNSGDRQGEVHDNLIRVVDEVFAAAEKRLGSLEQRLRGQTKTHRPRTGKQAEVRPAGPSGRPAGD